MSYLQQPHDCTLTDSTPLDYTMIHRGTGTLRPWNFYSALPTAKRSPFYSKSPIYVLVLIQRFAQKLDLKSEQHYCAYAKAQGQTDCAKEPTQPVSQMSITQGLPIIGPTCRQGQAKTSQVKHVKCYLPTHNTKLAAFFYFLDLKRKVDRANEDACQTPLAFLLYTSLCSLLPFQIQEEEWWRWTMSAPPICLNQMDRPKYY